MSKLLTIINAKLSDKSKLGDWYVKRLETCTGCEFNSENKENLSLRDKALVLANLGEPTCLACGCEIAAKASVETEECGAVKLNLPPRWEKIVVTEEGQYVVQNNSKDKVEISKPLNNVYKIEYGIIPVGYDSKINFTLSKKGIEVKDVSVKSSCGCTVPQAIVNDKNEILLSISYDTKRLGSFTKQTSVTIQQKNKKTDKLFFNINGIVK